MKIIKKCHLKNVIFTAVKNCNILPGPVFIMEHQGLDQYEPHDEKSCFLHMQEKRRRSAAWVTEQHVFFRYIDSIVLPKSEISSL